MRLTTEIKLTPTPEQSTALRQTMETANSACNRISEWAFEHKVFHRFGLHYALYYTIRDEFPLSAQMTVHCLAKVGDAYKLDRKGVRRFLPRGAVTYDDQILRWYKGRDEISIWASGKRHKIPFVCGERQRKLLESRQGETDLVLRDGEFYLMPTCNAPEPTLHQAEDFLGVDLGIANIASDSGGEQFAGNTIKGLRFRYARIRQRLDTKRTRAAKRLAKRRRRKEQRFARDVNHCISKKLVAKAEGTGRGIALEDLKGIRQRLVVRKAQRRIQHSWAFYQLRSFVEYKAKLAGVIVLTVDPRNTSRTCPSCGHIAKSNRPSQAVFRCVMCGFSGHADLIAAENIRRAAVNRPHAAAA